MLLLAMLMLWLMFFHLGNGYICANMALLTHTHTIMTTETVNFISELHSRAFLLRPEKRFPWIVPEASMSNAWIRWNFQNIHFCAFINFHPRTFAFHRNPYVLGKAVQEQIVEFSRWIRQCKRLHIPTLPKIRISEFQCQNESDWNRVCVRQQYRIRLQGNCGAWKTNALGFRLSAFDWMDNDSSAWPLRAPDVQHILNRLAFIHPNNLIYVLLAVARSLKPRESSI